MPITVEELRTRAQPWTAAISDSSPAGAVATFDPEYDKVRTEIAKRDSPSGGTVAWRVVMESGTDILQNKSKDLLIGSYVSYGLFVTRGLDGLVTGCAILTELIENYWPGMFPEAKRIRGRVNALTWFVEAVGSSLPSVQVQGSDRPAVEALSVAAKRLGQVAREKFADNTPAMRPLIDTVQQLLMSLPPEAPPPPPPPPPIETVPQPPLIATPPVVTPPVAPPPVNTTPVAPVAPVAPVTQAVAPPPVAAAPVNLPTAPTAAPTDSAEVVNFVRSVGDTLAEAGTNLRTADIASPLAYRLVRLGAWMHLVEAPPSEGGKARLGGPQPNVRAQLDKIAQNSRWAALIEEAESTLSVARFWLDINRYTATALAGLGHTRARDEVVRETAMLLKRIPELPTLNFADGSPFADDATRAWIASDVAGALGGGGGGSRSAGGPVVVTVAAPSGGGDDSAETAVAEEARKLAADGKVGDAVALLQSRVAGAGSAAGRFRARLALGQVCLSAGLLELSRAVYEALERDVTSHGLEVWEPGLAAAAAEGLLGCQRALAKGGKPLPPESAMLYDRLCRLDPAAALRLGA